MINPAANLATAEGIQEIPLGFLEDKQVHTKTFSVRLQRGGEARVQLMVQVVDNYVEYYQSIKVDHENNAFIYKDNVESFREMLDKLYRIFPELKSERSAIPGKQFVPYGDDKGPMPRDTRNTYDKPPQQFMNMNDDLSQSNASSEFKPPQANVRPLIINSPTPHEIQMKPQTDIRDHSIPAYNNEPRSLTPGNAGNFNPYSDTPSKQGPLQLSSQKNSGHPAMDNTSYVGYDSGSYRPTTQPMLKENRSLGYSSSAYTGAPTELVAYTAQRSYRGDS